MSEIVFAREGWLPRVVRVDDHLRLEIVGGADALGDARTFTVPISEDQAARIRDDLPRHVLLRGALIPLCYAAGSLRALDERAVVALLDPILFGTEGEIDALFGSVTWDKLGTISYGAAPALLDEGRIFAAAQSATAVHSWDRVRQYEAQSGSARARSSRVATMTNSPHVTVIIDAANCVGSVPDGWWRDRVGATRRLRDSISPDALRHALHLEGTPLVMLVVEGHARGVESSEVVGVVDAPGSGDDTIVDVVEQAIAAGGDTVVVTADRGLRSRVASLGARTVAPRVVRSS